MTFAASRPASTRDVYTTVEFQQWIGRTDLNPDEHFLITQFLNPKARTLEAGTGGGRILLAMRDMGFQNLHGFDLVPGLIEQGRAMDPAGAIRFSVQNAGRLEEKDNAYDQIIYLQQLVSVIDDDAVRASSIKEAFRILRPGGIAFFSALAYDARRRHPLYALWLVYWRVLRWITRSTRSIQYMPWLRLGGKFHRGALLDRGPYVYWFRVKEFAAALSAAGFEILGIGSSRQIAEGRLQATVEELSDREIRGALYCVCRKPDPGREGE